MGGKLKKCLLNKIGTLYLKMKQYTKLFYIKMLKSATLRIWNYKTKFWKLKPLKVKQNPHI